MSQIETTPTFSTTLRTGSRTDHAEAEHAPFVVDLFRGRLPVAAYAAMLGQLWHVYRALEAGNEALADDPVAGPFVDHRLDRVGALAADVAALTGAAPTAILPLAATEAYVARIVEVIATWPAGWVAHHYTRYLGDLSGGQAIRSVVERTYDLGAVGGTSFYDFAEIDGRVEFKDAYRARLDAAPWDLAEQHAVAAEVAEAYRLNTDLLLALGDATA